MKTVTCGTRTIHYAKKHHHVLAAWAQHRRGVSTPPHLVTLDYHTDLAPAFRKDCGEAISKRPLGPVDIATHAAPLLQRLSGLKTADVKDAIKRLTYEEHVDAAQQAGIIDHVFLLLSAPSGRKPKARQTIHRIYAGEPHEAAVTLEPATLDPFITKIETTTGSRLEDLPYILDVDLDVFRSAAAIRPTVETSWHRLIRNAWLITVALEPGCVRSGRLQGERITAKALLDAMKDHVRRA